MNPLSRRDFLHRSTQAALSAYALGGLGTLSASPAQAATAPNIVLIVADDLGWNDVGYHGGPVLTPNIDSLAAQGTQLDRFYAWPLCSPSRTALMTGRSPVRLGITEPITPESGLVGVPLEEHLLPQTFQAAGYQTWMCGKWHLGEEEGYRPDQRGFDHFYGLLGGQVDYYSHTSGRLDWQRNGETIREEGYTTFLLADEAVSLIETRDTEHPFLLYLSFNAPHAPLAAPQEFIDRYAAIDDPQRRTFAAMVDAMDGAIGQVLAALDREDLDKDTLVLFVSDNGANDGQGGDNTPLRGGKGQAFEGGIRTPAVLRWPGTVAAGQSSDQIVAAVDLFPTLAGAVGIAPQNEQPFDGNNRWKQVLGDQEKSAPEALVFVGSQTSAVLDGQWKLVRTPRGDSLYDIFADPTESQNLAPENPLVVQDLAALLEAGLVPDPTAVEEASSRPVAFMLAQNHPNPFNASTTISFEIPSDQYVVLEIFNTTGQKIATLTDQPLAAGRHTITWKAAGLASGTYFAAIDAGDATEKITMSLIK
jgi:arylsulfatase A-like enzyme